MRSIAFLSFPRRVFEYLCVQTHLKKSPWRKRLWGMPGDGGGEENPKDSARGGEWEERRGKPVWRKESGFVAQMGIPQPGTF
jgi:hypothetical protein